MILFVFSFVSFWSPLTLTHAKDPEIYCCWIRSDQCHNFPPPAKVKAKQNEFQFRFINTIRSSFYFSFPFSPLIPFFLIYLLSLPSRQRFMNFLCPLFVKCLFWRVISSPWNTSSRIVFSSAFLCELSTARFSGFTFVTTADFFDFHIFNAK